MSDRITLGEVMRRLLVDPDLPIEEGGRPLREVADLNPAQPLVWEARRASPANLADLTYEIFHCSGLGCGYSAFAALVQTYAEQFGAPYNNFPFPLLQHRRGRYSGAGKTCGALIGAGTFFDILWGKKAAAPQVRELHDWYAAVALPNYAPSAKVLEQCQGKGLDMRLPVSVATSALCTDSQVNWVKACNFSMEDRFKKERCGRITADVALKALEIVNRQAA